MSLSPACLLMLGAEGFTRLFSLDHPEIYCAPFAEERIGLLRQDPDLFWSLMPGFRGIHRGVTMTINTMGLRSPEVVRKVAGERRILSLGESTTLGIAVADSETYSAQLERLLTAASPRRTVVINAGVSAYSSYQSLKYLETQGLALQPDIVLFYHEVNDYLPTTVRDANNTIGVGMTDRELDLSRLNKACVSSARTPPFTARSSSTWRVFAPSVSTAVDPATLFRLSGSIRSSCLRASTPRRRTAGCSRRGLWTLAWERASAKASGSII